MPQSDSRLLISKKSFKTKISHFIEEANSINSFNQISESNLEAAKKSFRWWENRVKTYLNQSFSNNSVSREFSNSSGPILLKSAPFHRRCEKLINDIDEKVFRLKMVVESEDVKEELRSSKWKIPTINKIKWKLSDKIIVAIISGAALIISTLIGKSSTE